MKRASYRKAIEFAADFDSDVTDSELIANLLTVQLIATIFDVKDSRVAEDIQRQRLRTIDAENAMQSPHIEFEP
jgi:hypothetical protein